MLYNDYRILIVLRRMGASRFTDIHREAGCSLRTLSRHLKSLSQLGMVDRHGRKYLVTGEGLKSISRLERQLECFKQYKKEAGPSKQSDLVDTAVEVRKIGPSGHLCLGTFQVSLRGKLQLETRQELDRALTQAIRIASSAVPKGTKEYQMMINGKLEQQGSSERGRPRLFISAR